jgi:nicotinamidase-related amidase
MSKTALIIVDVQYDFLPPSGALAVPEGNQIIPRIKDLLSTDTGKWRSVIATQVRPYITSDYGADDRIITLKDIYHLHRVTKGVNPLMSLLSKMAGGGRRNIPFGLIIV